MKYVSEEEDFISAECERCRKEIRILRANSFLLPYMEIILESLGIMRIILIRG